MTDQHELRAIVAAQLKVSEDLIQDYAALADIGLDSMQLAEIVITLERLAGRPLEFGEVADHLNGDTTVGEFFAIVEQRLHGGAHESPP